jgi:hypothetical protein
MRSAARDVAIIAVTVVGLVLGLATQGQAVALRLTGPSATVTCQDQDLACDTNPGAGVVTSSLFIDLTQLIGTGTLNGSSMILDYSLTGGVTAGTPVPAYTFAFTADNLAGPSTFDTLLTGSQIGTRPGTELRLLGDLRNAQFAGSAICNSSGSGAFTPQACTTSPFGDPAFSLTELIQVTGATTASGRAIVTAQTAARVPEPGTLLLLVSGLSAAGMWGGGRTFRRRPEQ